MMTRWLIAGHGSVGSALARRLAHHGQRPAVYDPAPRVAIVDGEHVTRFDGATYDVVVSCVTPAMAADVLTTVRSTLRPDTLYLEWNTVAPETKRAIAAAAPCPVVDVALMDTLDDERLRPSLAISGPKADEARSLLEAIGFRVDDAGPVCGDAALLKLARSLFMKSLEALLVEFEAATSLLTGRDVITRSVEKNLGPDFMSFWRMLIETDRIHAARRARELQEAVTVFVGEGHPVRVAEASVAVLAAAADVWRAADAPGDKAGADALARYLGHHFGEPAVADAHR